MNKLILLLLLCVLTNQEIWAQDSKFGKVSKSELESTSCSFEPEASAAILCQKDRVYINSGIDGYYIEKYIKIKIYDKDKARSSLSHTFYLFEKNSDKELISNFKAVTYNLEDGKIIEDKIEKSNIAKDDVNSKVNSFSFTFPNVKNGSVLEYKLTFSSPFLYSINEISFQHPIPMVYGEYIFERPEFMQYQPITNGLVRPSSSDETSKPWEGTKYLNIITTLEFKNVEGLERESFVINYDNTRSSIAYELKGFTIPGYVYENYAMTWDAVFKSLDESENFGKQLTYSSFFDEEVSKLASAKNPLENAENILKYVQTNIVWNGSYGKFAENGVKKAFKSKSGNVSDINLILVNMLKSAGLKAYPVILSTVGNGYINPAFPTISKFNYVIAGFMYNNSFYMLDGTSPYSDLNLLPERCLTTMGYVADGTKHSTVPIMNIKQSRIKESIQAEIVNNEIKGNFKRVSNNYFAMNDLEEYTEDRNAFESDFTDKYKTQMSDVEFDRDDKFFSGAFSFTDTDNIEFVNDKILINPLLFLKNDKQIFNQTTRSHNIEFGSPFKNSIVVSIKIPEGYKVDFVPEDKAYKIENDYGTYLYKVNERNGTIYASTEISINTAILSADYYKSLQMLWEKIIENETQYVTLVKN